MDLRDENGSSTVTEYLKAGGKLGIWVSLFLNLQDQTDIMDGHDWKHNIRDWQEVNISQ